MRIAYSIPTWNGMRLLETLRSIPGNARTMVIDTKANDWSLSKAWNVAIDQLILKEGFDALMLINDDIVLRPDTGKKLAQALLVDQFDAEELGEWRGKLALVTGYNTYGANAQKDEGDRWGVGGPDYSCICIGKRYIDEVGWFDENFLAAYMEDNDSHRSIRMAGLEAAQFTPYLHYASTTINTDPERRKQITEPGGFFQKNRAYYISKWGGPPGQEIFTIPFNVQETEIATA